MNCLAIIFFAVSLADSAVTAGEPGRVFSPAAPCPGCNVVLVSFDALQAKRVHALGYPRLLTPTIDQMARDGAIFTQAVSPAPWTLPAHMSWFTGSYPSQHKVVNKFLVGPDGKLTQSNLQQITPGMRTLAEILKGGGYATGGFTGGAGVSGSFGFKAGFDVYADDVPPFTGLEVSIPKALKWLAKRDATTPFFLFLHGYGFHGQYQPPGGYDKRFVDPPYEGPYDGSPAQQRVLRELGLRHQIDLDEDDVRFWRDLYDEKVARTDAVFAGFLSAFRAMGLDKRTVFILASDHGTEEYEHKKFDHGHSLYDELERVLLVVVSPGIKGGQVIRAQVGTLGIMPTILSLIGVEADARLRQQMEGHSLLPLLEGRPDDGEDVFMETDYRLYTHKRGLRTRDGWKIVKTMENKTAELYDLNSDPQETKNLAAARPEKARELDKRLTDHYQVMGANLEHWSVGCSPVYPDQCH
ncbi:MAG: sulfatase [Elusimicrobia bacterium]|nr:sulfatase [Elusimicrobiota bacterium]